METLWNDIRFGLRNMRRTPLTVGAALLALALGIGANTAIFSVVNGILLDPLPYPDADRIMIVWESNPGQGYPTFAVASQNWLDWRAQSKTFATLAAVNPGRVNLTGRDEPEVLRVGKVSADFWPTFQVERMGGMLGRVFTAQEDTPANHHVVVLGNGLWKRRFGGDPSIVGRSLTLDGESYTVVGVAPQKLEFPAKAELWMPLAINPAKADRLQHNLFVVGRLAPGISQQRGQAEMTGITERLSHQFPETNENWLGLLVPIKEQVVQTIRPALLVLMVAVAAVLLIACLNVANLLLVRMASRERELAVRTALGAGRGRLVRQMLTESVLLALGGGLLGLLLAFWGVPALVALGGDKIPRAGNIHIHWQVLAFTLGISLLTGLLFGLLPAVQSSGNHLNESLKEGGRAVAGGARGRVARQVLVLAEVALALVLLVGAGLLIKSFSRLHDVDAGFRPQGVLAMDLAPPAFKYRKPEQQLAFYRDLLARVSTLPGVDHAGTVYPMPLSTSGMVLVYMVGDKPLPRLQDAPACDVRWASPGFFQTLRVPLLRGRFFDDRDTPASPPVAIVNRAFADKVWPGQDPVGKRITFDDAHQKDAVWLTVVGEVGNVRHQSLSQEPDAQAYRPQLQDPMRMASLVVHTRSDPRALAGPIRQQVQALDRDLPIDQVRTMQEIVDTSLAPNRFNTVLLGLLAALALVLAAVGVYGVVSYTVTQRTHEIGIRMALGAKGEDVLGLVLRQGMKLVLVGLVVGLFAAFAATRKLESLVYGVSTKDPWTFAVVALALAAVALAANFLPARRATRVDPLSALRQE